MKRLARIIVVVVAVVIASACGGGNGGGDDTASNDSTASSSTAADTTATTATTASTTTSSTRDETTEAPTTEAPADPGPPEIVADDPATVDHIEAALDLLEERAPFWYGEVIESIDRIQFVEAGSGMDVFTRTFRVGRQTAYAPGYPVDDQVEWLAGAMVHDACHSEAYVEGREWTGRDAELECLIEQADALALHEDGDVFETYVRSLIDGIDDPDNAYWTDPNRHW